MDVSQLYIKGTEIDIEYVKSLLKMIDSVSLANLKNGFVLQQKYELASIVREEELSRVTIDVPCEQLKIL